MNNSFSEETQIKRFSIAASMRRIVVALTAVIVILLNAVALLFGRQLLYQADAQVTSSLEAGCKDFDDQVFYLDSVLENVLTDNIYFKYLGDAYDSNDIYLYGSRVNIDLYDSAQVSTLGCYTYVFHSKNNYIHSLSDKRLTDVKAAGLFAFLENRTVSPTLIKTDEWELSFVCDDCYLIKTVNYKQAYAGMVIVLDAWDYFEKSLGYDNAVISFAVNGEIIASNTDDEIDHQGAYVESRCYLESFPLEVSCSVPNASVLGTAGRVSTYIGWFSIVLCLFIPIILSILRRHLMSPLKMMEDKISNIRYGTEVVPIEKVPAKEAAQVFMAFDSLLDEINDLKIEAYEEKLSMQKYRLQYLMLQLKPHFYLNFLKAVYALAGSEKYEEIQSMTKAMSEHFRYVVYNDSSLVSVREEIHHVQNYVKIQQMGHMFDIDVSYRVENSTLGLMIPTLSIQTFVENSIKYARMEGEVLKLDIRVSKMDDGEKEYIDMIVVDNGIGYDEEMIRRAQEGDFKQGRSSHVGLSNLYNRLKIMYGDDVYMILGEGKGKGALSEILIPLDKGDSAQ